MELRSGSPFIGALAIASLGGCDRTCHAPTCVGGGGGIGITATLDVPCYETAERTDILFDWSAVTEDLYCEPFDPVADVAMVGLTRFPLLSQAEVEYGLANDTILQSDTNGFVSCEPGVETQCWLSELAFGVTAYDMLSVWEEAGGTFLLGFWPATEPSSYAAPFLAFVCPTVDSAETAVHLASACGGMTVDVDLSAATAVSIGKDGAEIEADTASCEETDGRLWPIEWSTLSTSALGNPVRPEDVDQVVISPYEVGLQDIEARFQDRVALAAEIYTLAVANQTSADLGDARRDLVVPFEGFEGAGTWIIELRREGASFGLPLWMAVVAGR